MGRLKNENSLKQSAMLRSFTVKILASFLTCLVYFPYPCLGQSKTQKVVENVDAYMRYIYGHKYFNGAIIISDKDQILYSNGFGWANYGEKLPFTVNTPSDTGSLTKTFTAAAIFKLIELGELHLDAPVSYYLQDFPYPKIQIKHLLGHTSGIASDDFFFDSMPKDSIIANDFFLNKLIKERPELSFGPGERFEYSNVNFILLASIIESVYRQGYLFFLNHHFLKPLHLSDSFLRPPLLKDLEGIRAIGYNIESGAVNDIEDNEGFYGCCNMFFSTMDLHNWNLGFLKGTVFPNTHLRKGLERVQLNDGSLNQLNLLNWYVSDKRDSYHFSGDWKGFYSMSYWNILKERSITFVTNGTMPFWLRSRLVYDLNLIMDGNLVHNPVPPNALTIEDFEHIIGKYRMKNGTIYSLNKQDGQFYLKNEDGSFYKAFPVNSSVFYVAGMDAWLWFEDDIDTMLKMTISTISEIKNVRREIKD